MKNYIKKLLYLLHLIYLLPLLSIRIVYLGFKKKQGWPSIKLVVRTLTNGIAYSVILLKRYRDVLLTNDNDNVLGFDTPGQIERARGIIAGWHSLMPIDHLYTYSCIIIANNPNPCQFEACLHSILEQTAPKMEIIVGFLSSPDAKTFSIFDRLHQKYRDKLIRVDGEGSETDLINRLVKKASGNILVFCGQDGVMRCDLLFRFEQMFRMMPKPERAMIYSDEKVGNLLMKDFISLMFSAQRFLDASL